jgi:PAS domain S-box-containing protein
VAHTQEVRFALQALLSAMQDAETGQRGFLITGDEAYLDPYRAALAEVDGHLAEVGRLTADNPEQQRDLDAARPLIAAKLAALARGIAARRAGFDAAQRALLSGGGKQAMDELRRIIARMEGRERALLTAREERSAARYRLARTTTVASLAMGLALVGLVVLFSQRYARARQQAAQAPFAEREQLRITLTSIGDAVVVADVKGRVTLINGVARSLTKWGDDAVGRPLDEVMRIVNEETRAPVTPVAEVLRAGVVVGLANHSVLVARDGEEIPIDDSGAPIRDADGLLVGVVLVFRDVREQRRAEVALRESEERFRLLVGGVRDYAIFMIAPDGTVVSWNAGAERIKGYRADEIIGQHFSRFYTPEDVGRRAPQQLLEAATREGRAETEGWRVRKDGSRFLAHVLITALRDPQGTLRGFAKITRDVTEAKELEAVRESEAHFRQLAESMPQVVWTARPDGTIDYVNERIREYPGTLRQPDGAWRWEPTLHPEDLPATVRAWADAFRTGREFEITHRFRLADGSYRWHLSRGVPVRDARGIAVKWLGTSTDIHAQKQAEEELREASQRKSEFMAMLSHELRNPLAPIRNSLYVLERAAPGGQQARRAQEVIDRQTRQLTRLVEDLLDTTRITRGKIRLQVERLELCELVRRTADDHRDDFERGGIALEVTSCTPLIIDGDPARLSQAIGNLLANAVKFTPPGGRVALSVSAEASAAVVDVKDDGAGIAPSMLDSIFDPFTQGEQSLARTQGGLGLGLAITRGVAEMHGGTVKAQGEGPGKGARFELRLPLPLRPQLTVAAPPAVARAARRVLVIEDNPDAASSLKDSLELNGHVVEVANDGPEGIAKAHASRPDVVLCDIGLPGIDGYEVARRMRAAPELRSVALVALTGYASSEDVERALAAGFSRHLAKPPDLEQLERALAEAGWSPR